MMRLFARVSEAPGDEVVLRPKYLQVSAAVAIGRRHTGRLS